MSDQTTTTQAAYEKPEIKSYTEEEVLAAMETWGISGIGPSS